MRGLVEAQPARACSRRVARYNRSAVKYAGAGPLKEEPGTCRARKVDLLRRFGGEYILIRGGRIVGTFDSELDADCFVRTSR